MGTPSLHPLLHYLRCLGAPSGDGDDALLLQRFRTNHDESAFAAIVRRYGGMVWGLCVRRLGETPEAEDAFQATFLVLVRKAASLRGPELLGPWLHGVACRTALKVRGQRARRAARETPLLEQPAEQRTEQVWSDLRPVIDEEVNRLPEKYRRPVVLCYLQGLSSEEAARRLGCAKGTVFSRLSRARDLLRRRLMKRGLGVSADVLAAALADNTIVRSAPPAILSETTIRTGLLLAAGTARQALSAPLAALVEGVVRNMFLSKVKFAAIVLLSLGLVGTGAGFLGYRTDAEQPASKTKSPPAGAAAVADKGDKAKSKADDKAKNKADDKAKGSVAASEPYTPPPAMPDEKQRLRAWRDKLIQPVRFFGIDDPKITLNEALEALANRYNLSFSVNEKAFKFDNIQDVGKTEVASPNPIPAMNRNLNTILQFILERVPAPSGATFLVRRDHIEITTNTFLRMELGFQNQRPILPLVWDSFEDAPLSQILPRIAEASGYNVVMDPHAKEQLQTKITVQFNNVPVDTVLRLLMDMTDLSVVRLDNVFYVTTEERAKRLRAEQAKINADQPVMEEPVKKPASGKPAK